MIKERLAVLETKMDILIEDVGHLKSKVESLNIWKIKFMTITAFIATIITILVESIL